MIEIIISITGIVGALASILFQLFEKYFIKKTKKEETTEERIQKLIKSLQETTHLVNKIEDEINERSKLAEKLQNDIKFYDELVSIKKPEVEAITQLLRGKLKKESSASFWKGFAVNFLFFILGAVISIIITKWAV